MVVSKYEGLAVLQPKVPLAQRDCRIETDPAFNDAIRFRSLTFERPLPRLYRVSASPPAYRQYRSVPQRS